MLKRCNEWPCIRCQLPTLLFRECPSNWAYLPNSNTKSYAQKGGALREVLPVFKISSGIKTTIE